MRHIAKRWMPLGGGEARQLELALGRAFQAQKSKKQCVALALGVAGGVCLITASAIHRNLLLAVAPAAAGLLGCSAALWMTNKNGRGITDLPHAFLTQVPSDEKNSSQRQHLNTTGRPGYNW